jgi:hypothetical protein
MPFNLRLKTLPQITIYINNSSCSITHELKDCHSCESRNPKSKTMDSASSAE